MHAISGYVICGQVQMIGVMVGLALMSAAMTAVGQNLGADNAKRAERACWSVVYISALSASVLAAAYIIFARPLIGFFTQDPQAVHWGFVSLVMLSSVLPFVTVSMAFSGGLRGAGDTLSPLWATLICSTGIGPALAYTMAVSLRVGPTGAWLGLAIAIIVQAFIVGAIFKRGKWKRIKL